MEPATTIIEICGGHAAVARITGRDRSRVYRWTYAVENGGTGGRIPGEAQVVLMRYARAHDLPLRPEHFLPDDEADVSAVESASEAA